MKLTVANTGINTDAEGRFSLNDLHAAAMASGVTKDIRPNEWLSLDQTKGLVEVLITENPANKPVVAKVGRYGGTYVVKELVYAYAMWVSPAFHLQVIRAYDQLVTGSVTSVPDARAFLADPVQLRALLMGYTEKVLALEAKVEEQAPKVEFHDAVTDAINCQTVQEVAKVLGTGAKRLFQFLRDEGLLMAGNLPYQRYLDAGYFRVVEKQYRDRRGESNTYTQTLIAGKGLAYIQRRIQRPGQDMMEF